MHAFFFTMALKRVCGGSANAALRSSLRRLSTSRQPRAQVAAPPPPPSRLRVWTDLWRQQHDVFTLQGVNPNLVEFLPRLLPGLPTQEELEARKRRQNRLASLFSSSPRPAEQPSDPSAGPRAVFVPLCGRSADMAFLAEFGGDLLHIVGLDAIGEPLRLFANDHGRGLVPMAELPSSGDASQRGAPPVVSYRTERYPNLSLIHGDIFHVPPASLGTTFSAVWDRGGVTSIEDGDKQRYMSYLADVLEPGGRLLLEFLSCNLPLEGAASLAEMQTLLRSAGFIDVELVRTEDVQAAYPAFSPPGLSQLDEMVVLAHKPGSRQ